MKICTKCEIEKDEDEFHRHPATKDGLDPRCKECKSRLYLARSEDAFGESLRKYGLTLHEYTELIEAQGGVCLICRRNPEEMNRRFAVDHCHETGRIRGILCTACNSGLGMFGEDPDRLRRAIAYLEPSLTM